jgi:hypothetical protein
VAYTNSPPPLEIHLHQGHNPRWGLAPDQGSYQAGTDPAVGAEPAKSRWDLDAIRVLGTVPDRAAGKMLGKSYFSAKSMRIALGIPIVDIRTWDGNPVPQPFTDEELRTRWDEFKTRQRQKKRKERGSA